MRLIIAFMTLLLVTSVKAQDIGTSAEDDLQYYINWLIEENEEEEDSDDFNELFERLSEIHASPLNINSITREELEELGFLSKYQIEAILEYIDHYGPMRTKAELLMIPFLDDLRGGLLRTLIYLGESPIKEMDALDSLRYDDAVRRYSQFKANTSQGEVATMLQVPFYTRKGFEGTYQGDKYKHWIRANYKLTPKLKIGFTASQDAGEPFFRKPNSWGYDYYSGYAQLTKQGPLKKLVVGRYRMKTGMGLVLNNASSFGKMFLLPTLQNTSTSIHTHSSRSESNYMQGAAATFTLTKELEVTPFLSYRKIDATLTDDGEAIKTILKSGYHRTESELNRFHNASQSTAGANIRYNTEQFHLGATALFNHYSLPLRPIESDNTSLSQLYRQYYPTGNDFWNLSFDYGFRLGKKWFIDGETALSGLNKPATINTASYKINPRLSLQGIVRYYPYQFNAIMGRSFSTSSSNQNEEGVYIGATWNPTTSLSFSAYTDISYSPWFKYQILGSSYASDNLLQAVILPCQHGTLTLKYRMRIKQMDSNIKGVLINKNEHRIRVHYKWKNHIWTFNSHFDGNICQYKENSLGALLSQSAGYRQKNWNVTAGFGAFWTKDYNSRVYANEENMLYSFSSTSFFGQGIHCYSLAEANIVRNLSFAAKYSLTHYFDRNKIGSSYQEIKGSNQSDLSIMIRWKL